MANEFVIQAPTNSLQLNEQRQAEFTYNVFNASGRPLRAQAIIRTTPAGGEGWFNLAPAERDFPISHSEQYKLQITVPPRVPAGSYTFSLDMLWEGSEEPEQRTVTGQTVTFEVPQPVKIGTPWWVYAIAGGGLLLIIAVVLIVILSNRTVAVPDLAAMTADQARTALEKAGLKLKEPVSEDFSDTVPAGLVIRSDPGLDEKVKSGSEITVTISQGVEKFGVPEIADLQEAEARAKLEEVCDPRPCFNVAVNREDSDQVGFGLVIRSDPGVGEKLARGANVTLVVSNGAELHRTTTTILSNSPNTPQAFGSTTVFFNVAPHESTIPPIPTPVGTVSVSVVGGTQTCTGSLDASGQGSCLLSNLQVGASNLQATYNPQNAPFVASTSADYPLSVIKADAALVLQAQNPATSSIKGPASFTLAYSGSATVPTGTVKISAQNSDGSPAVCQNVAELVNGQGACSITFNTAGTWDLSYTYSGDSSYNPITTPKSLNATHSVSKYPTVVEITKTNSGFPFTNVVISYRVTKMPVNGTTLTDAITGKVIISIVGANVKCSGSINPSGVGSCKLPFIGLGLTGKKAVASYSGDDNFDASTSKPFTIKP